MLLIMNQMAQTLQVGQTPASPGSGSNSFEATETFVHLWVDQKTPFQNQHLKQLQPLEQVEVSVGNMYRASATLQQSLDPENPMKESHRS